MKKVSLSFIKKVILSCGIMFCSLNTFAAPEVCTTSVNTSLETLVKNYDNFIATNEIQDIDVAFSGSVRCMLEGIKEKVFTYQMVKEKSELNQVVYQENIKFIRDYKDYQSSDTIYLIMSELQKEWATKYFSKIGHHSSFLASFQRSPILAKWGILLGIGGGIAYTSKQFHQEIRLIKTLVKVYPRKAFLALLMSPFGRTGIGGFSGLASNEFRRIKGKEQGIKEATGSTEEDEILEIPVSPANVLIANGEEDFYMNYDMYSAVKDISAVGSGAVGGALYAYTRTGRTLNYLLKNKLSAFYSQVAKTDAFKTLARTKFIDSHMAKLAKDGLFKGMTGTRLAEAYAAHVVKKEVLKTVVKTSFIRGAAIGVLKKLRYSKIFTGWTPIIIIGTVLEMSVNKIYEWWNYNAQEAKLVEKRNAFLTIVKESENAGQVLPFLAEIYTIGVAEFVHFLTDNFKNSIESRVYVYEQSRFCSSYNYVYRRYIDTNPRSFRKSTAFNRYSIYKNPNTEFDGVTALNRQLFSEKIRKDYEHNKNNIDTAYNIITVALQDLQGLVEISDLANRAFYELLIVRLKNLQNLTNSFSFEDLEEHVFASSEELVFNQFANVDYLLNKYKMNDDEVKQATANRYCHGSDSTITFQTAEDVWRCYLPVAQVFGCTPAFAAYQSE